MTENEFRADKGAVDALNAFLSSGDGQKFLSVLEEESILNKLSSSANQTERGVRDLAVVETGSTDNLLGRCIGYNLIVRMLKRLRSKITEAAPQPQSRAGRVAKTMRAQENLAETN